MSCVFAVWLLVFLLVRQLMIMQGLFRWEFCRSVPFFALLRQLPLGGITVVCKNMLYHKLEPSTWV